MTDDRQESEEPEKFVDQEDDVDDGKGEETADQIFDRYLQKLEKENQQAAEFVRKHGVVSPSWARGMKIGEDMNPVFASPEQEQEFQRLIGKTDDQ